MKSIVLLTLISLPSYGFHPDTLQAVEDITSKAVQEYQQKEVDCLAKTLYYEANTEGEKGMLIVANVIKNRIAHKDFPDTICGVVADKRAPFSSYKAVQRSMGKDRGEGYGRYREAYKVAHRAIQEVRQPSKVVSFKVCSHPSKFFDKLVLVFKYKQHCYYRGK